MATIGDIPDDIIAQVLSIRIGDFFLSCLNEHGTIYSIFSQVCQRWRKILKEKNQFDFYRVDRFSRSELLDMAKNSLKNENYNESLPQMLRVLKLDKSIPREDRTAFSQSLQYFVRVRQEDARSKSPDQKTEQARSEIVTGCKAVIRVLDKFLEVEKDTPRRVFFYKTVADAHRFIAEVPSRMDASFHKDLALKYYVEGCTIAESLQPTNPERLALSCNYSSCCVEVLNKMDQGCNIAKQAFDDAISSLDCLDDEDYQAATMVMQLIRDKLVIWTLDE